MVTTLYFIDESGNFRPHDPTKNNNGERFCTLTVIKIKDSEYKKFKEELHALKTKYNQYINNKEIKSRSIRRSNPLQVDPSEPPDYDFWRFEEQGKRDYHTFCVELEKVVTDTTFDVISVSVDKIFAQSRYPYSNILNTMMTDLWERIFICHVICKVEKSRIFFDPQLSITDEVLKQTYERFIGSGSWFIKPEDLGKVNLYKNIFSPDSEASCGIQLADYCAYPIKRYVETGRYGFFTRAISPKLHRAAMDKRRNKNIFMGIKKSLSR
jgi:hypothetical protein